MDPRNLRRKVSGDGRRPGAGVLVLLLMACLTVITLDARGGTSSPVEPLRGAVGSVIGPVEQAADAAARPFARLGETLHTNRSLRRQVATLAAENSRLRGDQETATLDRERLRQLEELTGTAQRTGYTLVTARVVGVGPAQSFGQTVTIDAGTSAGVRADMTVLNGDGLVGRVVRATRTTATVLLVVDAGSTVGGRLGASLELGSVRGRGGLAGDTLLDLDLIDDSVTPKKGDTVLTWGSEDGVPYVAGVPIGKVVGVQSTPRELTRHAVLRPFVDFSALDLVGVVVPSGTQGDRPVIGGDPRERS